MAADLLLICHGDTQAVREAAFPSDEPLRPGAAEAIKQMAGGSLSRITRARTSPALRARQTADALGLEAQPDPALAECDYGRWAGCRLTEIAAAQPDALQLWLTDLDAVPHGGEPLSAVLSRVGSWLHARIGETGRMAAVTHPTVLRAAIMRVLDAPAAAFWRIDIGPLDTVRLRSDGRRWALRAAPLA